MKENEQITENTKNAVLTIYNTSREFKKSEIYALTQSADTISIKDLADGSKILVTDYISFAKVDRKGNLVTLFGIATKGLEAVFLTQSETFKKEFEGMVESLNDGEISDMRPLPIIKLSGESKNGREYVSCKLDVQTYSDLYEK